MPKVRSETTIKGVPISPGVAVGAVCLFNEGRHNRVIARRIELSESAGELKRMEEALRAVEIKLDEIRTQVARGVGAAEAEIFEAQRMILDDAHLRQRLQEGIRRDLSNAEASVIKVFDAYEARLRGMDNARFRERASDIAEIKQRLLDALGDTSPTLACEGQTHCQRGRNRVVVARELTPTLTVELDTEHLLGFATEHGGATSHAGILARALGIPAVSGLAGIYDTLSCGTEVLVNGNTGEVILWPNAGTLAAAEKKSAGIRRAEEAVDPVPGFKVMANISRASEIREATRMKAEGIGLYRTEFEFLAAGRVLSEDEQFERYAEVVRAAGGRAVYLRLLDIGGEKAAPFLRLPPEANPGLGFRGARLLLGRPDLLEPQARAVARASRLGEIHVVYPMIVDRAQFEKLRHLFDEATRRVRGKRLKQGVMFEVPSACLQANDILRAADFGSIGTNDLVQYLFAVDRNNEMVSADFKPDHPLLWSLIADIAAAAERAKKTIAVCGEVGGTPRLVGRLMSAGIEAVSVNPRMISQVRRAAAAARRRRA